LPETNSFSLAVGPGGLVAGRPGHQLGFEVAFKLRLHLLTPPLARFALFYLTLLAIFVQTFEALLKLLVGPFLMMHSPQTILLPLLFLLLRPLNPVNGHLLMLLVGHQPREDLVALFLSHFLLVLGKPDWQLPISSRRGNVELLGDSIEAISLGIISFPVNWGGSSLRALSLQVVVSLLIVSGFEVGSFGCCVESERVTSVTRLGEVLSVKLGIVLWMEFVLFKSNLRRV
jgi:hypothetical protein